METSLPAAGPSGGAASPSSPSSPGIALVTGGARRLGRAIALALARDGWDIVIHYRDSAVEAEEAVAEIVALGRRAVAVRAVLEREDEVAALPALCAERLGELRCIVNNASLFEYDLAADFTYAGLERHARINLGAPMLLARELHKRLPAEAVGAAAGVVINLLDRKLLRYNPDYLTYSVAKAGLQAATVMLAQALAPRVRVVGVAPGAVLSSPFLTEDHLARLPGQRVLADLTRPADIAGAVCYLARAQAVTGVTLTVDAGEHLVAAARDVAFLPPEH